MKILLSLFHDIPIKH